MTDIVERLRISAKDWKMEGEMSGGECVYAFDKLSAELEEAAKEIDRLRANIERLTNNPADYRYLEGRYRDEAADNERLRAALEAACNHVEWLLRYVPKTGSSDAAGAAVNARDFLEKSRRALEGKDE